MKETKEGKQVKKTRMKKSKSFVNI